MDVKAMTVAQLRETLAALEAQAIDTDTEADMQKARYDLVTGELRERGRM